MIIEKCRRCSRIIPGMAKTICPKCRKELDVAYERARTFIKDNPDLNFHRNEFEELAEQANLPARDIEILIEEGFLELEGVEGDFEEENDGGIAKTGKEKLLQQFRESLDKKTDSQKKHQTYGKERHGR